MKLCKIWKTSEKWRMISLGKGFFEFQFSNGDDMRKIWVQGMGKEASLDVGLLQK